MKGTKLEGKVQNLCQEGSESVYLIKPSHIFDEISVIHKDNSYQQEVRTILFFSSSYFSSKCRLMHPIRPFYGASLILTFSVLPQTCISWCFLNLPFDNVPLMGPYHEKSVHIDMVWEEMWSSTYICNFFFFFFGGC